MAVAHGSCLCKKVQYEVELPFDRFVYCHCSRCRKATGSAHAANGLVKAEAFRWTQGESFVKRYDLPEAKRFGLQFCSECGSKVPHMRRDRSGMVIPAGSLDNDPGTRPDTVIFWGSRATWYTEPSAMKQHDETPG